MIRIGYSHWRNRPSPIVEVEVSRGSRRILTNAFLDTGASYCIFNSDYSAQLDCEMKTGRKVRLVVGNGEHITIFLHWLKLRIGALELEGEVGFSQELGTNINIIGRTGVMDEYMICFDGPNQEVIWHC